MRKIMTWFWLSLKRYVRKISFVLILFLLPAASFLAGRAEKKENQSVNIAVTLEGDQKGKLGERLMESLLSRDSKREGMFHFYECGSEQELEREVASKRAECGYVIYEDLEQRLDAKQYKRCIGVYSAPSTVLASLSTETVFAALAQQYDRELLVDYAASGTIFEELGAAGTAKRAEAAQEAGKLYDKWLNNGSTFHFEYEYQEPDGSRTAMEQGGAAAVFPVRGFVAVYLLVVGLYGAVMAGTDAEKGLFLPLAYGLRLPCRVACVAGPVCLAAVSGLAALWSGGGQQDPLKELLAMAGYVAAVVLFSCLLGMICRSPRMLCILIPFFMIGSMVFCPVLIDVGRYIPAFGQVGRLFLPFYYLRLF